jgi:ATP-binding cassette, subfamily B (MDR/TAP), member 1
MEIDIEAAAPSEGPPTSCESLEWASLFVFYRREHFTYLVGCVISAILSGAILPGLSILIGKVFDAYATYGRNIEFPEARSNLLEDIRPFVKAIAGLGAGSLVVNGSLFALWAAFSEAMAKDARMKIFAALISQDMEWYDLRENGIVSLVMRYHG